MKHTLITSLLFLVSFWLHAVPLFFVHLGPQLPVYVMTCLQQARLFHKDEIFLVASQISFNPVREECQQLHIQHIPIEQLTPNKPHLKYLKYTPQQSFWRYTTERFFYLEEAMDHTGKTAGFHMEYDNMLYADTKQLEAPLMRLCQGMAVTFDNDDRGIAGFMFIKDAKELARFNQFIADQAPHGYNDMQLLALYNQEKKSLILPLPIIMPNYDQPLITPTGKKAKNPSLYSYYTKQLGYIFDAAALGQYLGGIDPRNGVSEPGFVNESCVFNPSLLTYEWHIDELGRKIPMALYGDRIIAIGNLHIHSKRLALFKSL